MLDFCFTVVIFHFVAVSAWMREFPAVGAWWAFLGIGFVVQVIFAEVAGYHLETMERKARLVDPVKEARRQVCDVCSCVTNHNSRKQQRGNNVRHRRDIVNHVVVGKRVVAIAHPH